MVEPAGDTGLVLDRLAAPLRDRLRAGYLEGEAPLLDGVLRLPDIGKRTLPDAAIEPILPQSGTSAQQRGQSPAQSNS